ncbi:1465_t:CDS:2 [Ambispora leptoticha]|uniref:1465_t:CDS:1 n=1 Tax=Ambispora leptoticha TaxID=144679 RepID=A0A9N9AHN6_9GLOM|nr:1465_t:CDS:2 [Ambispora leptoticha]
MPQEPKPKKKRVPITALTKRNICIKKRDNAKLRDEDLAREYGLDRSTITKILKNREKWLAIDPNSNNAKQKTQKSPKFPQIEESLATWLDMVLGEGAAVSDMQLQEKALEIAQTYGIRNEFQASNGWISKFKLRHQFRSGESPGAGDVSLQVNQQPTIPGTSVLSPAEHSYVNLFPTTYPHTNSKANQTNTLSLGTSTPSPFIPYGASHPTPMGTSYSPSRIYPIPSSITPNFSIENTAFLFCDYQNDIIGMNQNSQTLNQFLSRSRQLFRAVHQARQKRNSITSVSIGTSFRPGYPEVSPNNQNFVLLKLYGRLIEGTKGAEFIDGLVPAETEDDIVIKKRRLDAFYNTDLKMILESRNIKHIVLAGINTGGVILSTTRSACDMDFRITVVKECCFDGSETVQNVLMDEIFPRQGIAAMNVDVILNELR